MAADQRMAITIDIDDAGARTKLRELDTATDKVGKTATSMGGAFEKTLQRVTSSTFETQKSATEMHRAMLEAFENPMAAMKAFGQSLTSDVLEVLGPIGIAGGVVTGVMTGLGLALFEVAEHAAHVGASLSDQAQKTGIAVPALSKLSQAATIAGTSVDQIGAAMFMFQERSVTSADSVAAGVARMHLSFDTLMRMAPDQQLLAIGHALAQMTDPTQRNAASVELFGRQARDLVPLLVDLDQAMEKTAGLSVFTEEEAQRAKEYEMDIAALKLQVEDLFVVVGKDLIPVLSKAMPYVRGSVLWFLTEAELLAQKVKIAVDSVAPAASIAAGALMATPDRPFPQAPGAPAVAIDNGADAMARQTEMAGVLEAHLRSLLDASTSLTGEQQRQAAVMLDGGDSVDAIAKIYLHVAVPAVEQFKKSLAFSRAELKNWNEAFAELGPILASPDWDGTIESTLKLGGSVSATATYFGEMKGTVEGVRYTLEQEKSTLDRVMSAHEENVAAIKDTIKTINDGGGLHETLETLSQTMGDNILVSRQLGNELITSFGISVDTASRHVSELTDRTEEFNQRLSDSLQGADEILGNFDNKFSQVGQDVVRTLDHVSQRLEEGDVFGAVVAAVAGGIKTLIDIGAPSKDELAARSTFDQFQKQFGSLQQTIDAVGAEYVAVGHTGVEAQRDLQRALDATHLSAAAEQQALDKINGVLQEQKKYIDDVTKAGAGLAGQMNDIVAGTPFAGLHSDLMAAQKTVHDLMGAGESQDSDKFKTAMDTLNGVTARVASTAKHAGGELRDLGTEAVAAFAAAVGSGQDEQTALKSLHPTLATLADAYHDLGLSTDDVALHTLMLRDQIMTAAPQLVGAVSGLTGEMNALNTMGLLNVDTLGALERTGAQTYDRLVAKVHELGGTDTDALGQMQGFLHAAEDAAKKLGIPLDDNTQKLVDQSVKAGIWQDAITPQDKLLKGMQDLIDHVQTLIDHLNGIPQGVHTTVTTDYIDRHTTVDVAAAAADVTGWGNGGGYVTPAGIQYLASGNVVRPLAWNPRGSDTVLAGLTPGEGVLNRSAMRRVGANGLKALNNGGSLGGDTTVINNYITVEGSVRSDRELAAIVQKHTNGSLDRRRRIS
jgi:hypothetical protein